MRDCLGYNVVLVQNITDIDDKIIIRSSERSMPFTELARTYEAEFHTGISPFLSFFCLIFSAL